MAEVSDAEQLLIYEAAGQNELARRLRLRIGKKAPVEKPAEKAVEPAKKSDESKWRR